MSESTHCTADDQLADNQEDAEALRCQLVRSLSMALKQRKHPPHPLAEAIAGRFVRDYAWPFYCNHESANQMFQGLIPIIQQAVELAWQVWSRKARLDVFGCSERTAEIMYSSKSDMLELHALHGRDVDDDPQALDGKRVLLVCSPVVLLAGNADGKEYEKQRVVKKAVVWLG